MTEKTIKFGLQLIKLFGYPGLFLGLFLEFVGIAFPGEIFLTFTGFLVWNKKLHFMAALLSAVAGSVGGTVVAYFIGFRFGIPFLERYGRYFFMNPKSIDRAERWFNKHGLIVLLIGRFVPGVRPLSSYMAGISTMKFWQFLPLSVIGAFVWCLTFILIGTQLGQNWHHVTGILEKYDLILAAFLIMILLIYVVRKGLELVKH